MDQTKDVSAMGTDSKIINNSPTWLEYKAQLLQSLKESGLSPAIIDARIQIAYNRMHGIVNKRELLEAAHSDQSSTHEWPIGTMGSEVF